MKRLQKERMCIIALNLLLTSFVSWAGTVLVERIENPMFALYALIGVVVCSVFGTLGLILALEKRFFPTLHAESDHMRRQMQQNPSRTAIPRDSLSDMWDTPEEDEAWKNL